MADSVGKSVRISGLFCPKCAFLLGFRANGCSQGGFRMIKKNLFM